MSRLTNPTIALSALLLVAGAVRVSAAETDDATARVNTKGLNLNTTLGVTGLQHRIQGAARSVCGDADNRDLQAMEDMNRCRALAMEGADLQMRAAVASARRPARLAAAGHTEITDNLR